MDSTLEFLHSIIKVLHFLAAFAVILKCVIVFKSKGFNMPAVITSFFRIYTKSDFYMSSNQNRKQFMRTNNVINYYLWIWLFCVIIHLVVFESFW